MKADLIVFYVYKLDINLSPYLQNKFNQPLYFQNYTLVVIKNDKLVIQCFHLIISSSLF